MLAPEHLTDPTCMQTYFYDPGFQPNLRALRHSTITIKREEILLEKTAKLTLCVEDSVEKNYRSIGNKMTGCLQEKSVLVHNIRVQMANPKHVIQRIRI